LDALFAAAGQFKPQGKVIHIREFGNGNINSTFLVTFSLESEREGEREKHFILQRVNTRVFRRPELVMQNMRVATGHLLRRLERAPFIRKKGLRRWEVPIVLLTGEGLDHWVDPEGSFWRALSFIEGARTFDSIRDAGHAREVGCALGIFHMLLGDLPPETLADTLEGFHITPRYLAHYEKVLAQYGAPKSPEANYCLRFVSGRTALAHILEKAKAEGRLFLRPIHGDPKVNNILIDTATGQSIGIIDLDTVKPGLLHYDIGDCLRSGANPMGEDSPEWEKVRFDADLCRAILDGYFSTAGGSLTANDFEYLYDSMRLIAFELGLRFFTDYLEGNVYFKVKSPEHNLLRALVQFRLVESIESQERAIRAIIGEAR